MTKQKRNQSPTVALQNHTGNLFPKTFIPLYLEDLRFLIKRCRWKVTKIYSHLKFEQSCFKREFVLTNQRKRQEAKSSIEKDFYKLMNNANFGNDCRDNRNYTKFLQIVDEIEEIIYIKKILIKNLNKIFPL